MKRHVDKAGTPLQVGDYIVYGHALGRCAGLQYGKILALLPAKKATQEPHWHPAVEAKIRVQGVDWDWDGRSPSLLRPSTLQFEDRVLRVTETQVHPKVLALLKKVGE